MKTKVCTKCGRELPLDSFNWRDKAKGTRRADCRDCHNNYMKKQYQQKKIEIQDLKAELRCAKCGYNKCGAALDFHHINPEDKDDTVARMLSNNYSLERVQNEIKKCVVLCANCHREFHFLNNNNSDYTLDIFLQEE